MSSISLETLRLWNVHSLQAFCKKKGLKIKGSKEELLARVFCAHELSLPDVQTEEERLQANASRYNTLLHTSKEKLPDPFDWDGWIGEEKGVSSWPPTMYVDICEYFHSLTGQINQGVTKTALNYYKEGKAYSYFDSSWLKEIFYHPIDSQSQCCYLKAKCTASMKINNVPHNVWVLINKSSGEIKSAYCTCFAGLGSTCNHVAAVLFKLDFYWREGITNKSCTEIPCVWNKYGAEKTNLKPVMVKDLLFRKPRFGKIKKNPSKVVSKEGSLADANPHLSAFSFNELADALRDCCPNAVVFKSQGPTSPHDIALEVSVSTSAKPSLKELYGNCTTSDDILHILNSFTKDDVNVLEVATQGQSNNNIWVVQRNYRITASIVHEVYTKVQSLKAKKRSQDPTPLLKKISGSVPNYSKSIPALKYGNEMESEARNCYKELISSSHKDVSVHETGIIISHENPEFGASPDASVTCSCCPPGLLEIKCPISIAHTSPNETNQDCLLKTEKSVQLKRPSKYFSQIQWQMGICGRSWCDFFIYSRHGHFLEKVPFDRIYFEELKSNASFFYTSYVIPFVVKERSLQKDDNSIESQTDQIVDLTADNLIVSQTDQIVDLTADNLIVSQTDQVVDLTADSVTDEHSCTSSAAHVPLINFESTKRKYPPKIVSKNKKQKLSLPTYICGACSKVCLEPHQIISDGDNSVQCDFCGIWFHFACVKYTPVDIWVCQSCII